MGNQNTKGSSSKFNYNEAFSRNFGWVTHDQQMKLKNCRVAIAGLGGVGGQHLLTLVRLGITKFHLAEFDTFEIQNFNRQVGAKISTLNRSKLDVMIEEARDINPEIEIRTFPQGLTSANKDQFLEGVDVYVDGLDAFVLEERSMIFEACYRKNIPAVTVAPIGMGASLINFMPGKMTFDQYFGLKKSKSETEKIGRFILGLTPSRIQMKSIADEAGFNLHEKKGASTPMGCALAAGVLGTEVLKILLKRGRIVAAPHGIHFDAFTNTCKKTWMPFGATNPLFQLKLLIFRWLYMRPKNTQSKIEKVKTVQMPAIEERSRNLEDRNL